MTLAFPIRSDDDEQLVWSQVRHMRSWCVKEKLSQVWEMVLMDGVCTCHAEGVVGKSHDPGVVFGDGRARS